MLRAIAIDDEPIALDIIQKLSSQVDYLDFKAGFVNAFEGLQYLEQNPVDLLFLDIKMPDISGMELLKKLPEPPMTIFTTAYSEHAVQSFELNAVDYLLKPFSFNRFLKACNKANELFNLRKKPGTSQGSEHHLFIRTGNEQVRIETDDIVYVQSAGNYVQFVSNTSKHMSRLTMNQAEAMLPAEKFTRIHRSYIVGNKWIMKFDRSNVVAGKTKLPLGSSYLPVLEKLFAK